jgi:3'-5' exoribonuclease
VRQLTEMTMLPPINRLTPDTAGVGFYLCCSKELRQAGRGEFMALTLQDATGQLPARVFENVEAAAAEFDEGEFVKVQGRAHVHHGRLQLVVERIRRVIDADRQSGFREDDCLAVAPRPIDEMWLELEQVIGGVGNANLRTLLQRVTAARATDLRRWPAAVTVHHAYRGGLLEHALAVAASARALAHLYSADEDLVVAGALLHDIGKLDELTYDVTTGYSASGNLVGHITLGVLAVHEACASIGGFPDDLRLQLEHLMVSHHGRRELGSPAEPMTVEAFILAAADDLDAKVNQVRQALAADAGDGEFTGHHKRLGRVLWKGTRAETRSVSG